LLAVQIRRTFQVIRRVEQERNDLPVAYIWRQTAAAAGSASGRRVGFGLAGVYASRRPSAIHRIAGRGCDAAHCQELPGILPDSGPSSAGNDTTRLPGTDLILTQHPFS
jgi:hypothetical protein